jgi:hypothetical protein
MAAVHTQHAAAAIRRTIRALDKSTDAAEAYLASIAGGASSAAPAVPVAPSRQTAPLRDADIDRLRDGLPPPITDIERGTGRKTHGRWVGEDGATHRVISGVDEWSQRADTFFAQWDMGPFVVASHAEMKVAARIRFEFARSGQARHVTVVLNNRPCKLRNGCERLLPVMLPDGCSLTVYAPDYRRTFTGRLTS